jgi:hypothetical protein
MHQWSSRRSELRATGTASRASLYKTIPYREYQQACPQQGRVPPAVLARKNDGSHLEPTIAVSQQQQDCHDPRNHQKRNNHPILTFVA